jgi:riboflavin synthase
MTQSHGLFRTSSVHFLNVQETKKMFTGIIEAVGKIAQITQKPNALGLRIASDKLDMSDVKVGDSIAVNGVCLTVTSFENTFFSFDVSDETLNCTHGLNSVGNYVNLEKAMRLMDRLGGHLVSGHVDGIGEVIKFEQVGENYLLAIKVPASLLKYIAVKGSITVNGVSLTINRIHDDRLEINLIPHTLAETNLKFLKPGERLNLETDMLARYIARLIDVSSPTLTK